MWFRRRSSLSNDNPRTVLLSSWPVLVAFGLVTLLIIKDQMRRATSLAGVYKGWMPWAMPRSSTAWCTNACAWGF